MEEIKKIMKIAIKFKILEFHGILSSTVNQISTIPYFIFNFVEKSCVMHICSQFSFVFIPDLILYLNLGYLQFIHFQLNRFLKWNKKYDEWDMFSYTKCFSHMEIDILKKANKEENHLFISIIMIHSDSFVFMEEL